MRQSSLILRTASKTLSCPMMFVTSDSVGAFHEVGTKLCAARWKIQSGRISSIASRVDVASRRSHSTSFTRSQM